MHACMHSFLSEAARNSCELRYSTLLHYTTLHYLQKLLCITLHRIAWHCIIYVEVHTHVHTCMHTCMHPNHYMQCVNHRHYMNELPHIARLALHDITSHYCTHVTLHTRMVHTMHAEHALHDSLHIQPKVQYRHCTHCTQYIYYIHCMQYITL